MVQNHDVYQCSVFLLFFFKIRGCSMLPKNSALFPDIETSKHLIVRRIFSSCIVLKLANHRKHEY